MNNISATAGLLTALALAGCATAQVATGGALNAGREVVVDTPPSTVWKLIGNFDGLDVWHPAVVRSVQTGSGASLVRVLTLGDGATVTEPLVSYDDKQFS